MSYKGASKGEKAATATVSTSAWKWKSIAAAAAAGRGAFCSGLIRVKEREGERGDQELQCVCMGADIPPIHSAHYLLQI